MERTVARIEQVLAEAGASSIIKDYVDGQLSALCFTVSLPTGRPVQIRLPANHDAVYQSMKREIKRPRPGTLDRVEEQALRTSWKLMQDWVEVQLTLIKMQRVDFMQVFLPYLWDGRNTFYEALKSRSQFALPEMCADSSPIKK